LGHQAQSAGDSIAPVAYLSKQLDYIYRGWLACLNVLATTPLLIPKTQKITFNLPMTVWSSHNIQDLISTKALSYIFPSHVQILHSSLTTWSNFPEMSATKPYYPLTLKHPT
jgi:hypothetical protein